VRNRVSALRAVGCKPDSKEIAEIEEHVATLDAYRIATNRGIATYSNNDRE
jgi:hypothetical protein